MIFKDKPVFINVGDPLEDSMLVAAEDEIFHSCIDEKCVLVIVVKTGAKRRIYAACYGCCVEFLQETFKLGINQL